MIRRRSEFGRFFIAAAVVLGLVIAAGAFLGSPGHAQAGPGKGLLITDNWLILEEGITGLFNVVLDGLPAGDVTVTIEGATGTDVTLNPDSLTFTSQNWNRFQRVFVKAEHDDDLADEPKIILTFTTSSLDDGDYDSLEPVTRPVDITDDDRPGVTLTPTQVSNDEGGGPMTYTVALDSRPTAEATVKAYTELLEEPWERFLTFTTQNWDIPQEVQVDFAPVDSNTDDSVYYVLHAASTSRKYVTVRSTDHDVRVSFSFGEGPLVEVAEDAETVRVEVVAVTIEEGAPTTDYAVKLVSKNRTARPGRDFRGVNKRLDFPKDGFAEFVNGNGETRYRQTVTLDVNIIDNEIAEHPEYFQLILEYSLEFDYLGALIAYPNIKRVTINDDDTGG